MKIGIREALFGGEELDDWEPTKNSWIIIKDFRDLIWTDEFTSIKNCKKKDWVKVARRIHLELEGSEPYWVVVIDCEIQPDDSYRYYYDTNSNQALFMSKTELEKLGDSNLDTIFDWLTNNEVHGGSTYLKELGIVL